MSSFGIREYRVIPEDRAHAIQYVNVQDLFIGSPVRSVQVTYTKHGFIDTTQLTYEVDSSYREIETNTVTMNKYDWIVLPAKGGLYVITDKEFRNRYEPKE